MTILIWCDNSIEIKLRSMICIYLPIVHSTNSKWWNKIIGIEFMCEHTSLSLSFTDWYLHKIGSHAWYLLWKLSSYESYIFSCFFFFISQVKFIHCSLNVIEYKMDENSWCMQLNYEYGIYVALTWALRAFDSLNRFQEANFSKHKIINDTKVLIWNSFMRHC